jgi:hypothetical protein
LCAGISEQYNACAFKRNLFFVYACKYSNKFYAEAMSTAPRTKSMFPVEAKMLSISLGAKTFGDQYSNPEVFGLVAHCVDNDIPLSFTNWKENAYRKNPEPYQKYIQDQKEAYQSIIDPYIGKLALAKTARISIMDEAGDWQYIVSGSRYGYGSRPPYFVHGVISGAEGRIARTQSGGLTYRLGIEFDTSEGYISQGGIPDEPLPVASSVLVSPASFPTSETWFHHLMSDQIEPWSGHIPERFAS